MSTAIGKFFKPAKYIFKKTVGSVAKMPLTQAKAAVKIVQGDTKGAWDVIKGDVIKEVKKAKEKASRDPRLLETINKAYKKEAVSAAYEIGGVVGKRVNESTALTESVLRETNVMNDIKNTKMKDFFNKVITFVKTYWYVVMLIIIAFLIVVKFLKKRK